MSTKRSAPLAGMPAEMLPKKVYLLVSRGYDDTTIERAYMTREAAERNLTLGLRADYIDYLTNHATNLMGLMPDTDPTPLSFVDFASRHTDLEIEEVEVIG